MLPESAPRGALALCEIDGDAGHAGVLVERPSGGPKLTERGRRTRLGSSAVVADCGGTGRAHDSRSHIDLAHTLPIGAGQLEAQRLGFGLPPLEQPLAADVAFRLSRPQCCQLHPFRRLVSVRLGRSLDRLAAFRERALDVTRDRGHAKAVRCPLDRVAGALQLGGERRSIHGAGLLLRLVQLAADDGAPGAIPARRQVENEHMRVQLRIELAAGVVIEPRQNSPAVGSRTAPPLPRLANAAVRSRWRVAAATATPCAISMPGRSRGSESAHSTDTAFGALKVMSQPAAWFKLLPPSRAI